MIGDEQFWSQVQLALDERRDPLADGAILEGIVESPERLHKVLGMLERIEQLARVTDNRAPHESDRWPQRLPVRRIAVAAAVLIAAGSSLFWFTQHENIVPQPATSLQSRVISIEWEISTQTPTSNRSVVISERGLTAKTEYGSDPRHDTTWTTESTRARYP